MYSRNRQAKKKSNDPTLDALFSIFGILNEEESTELTEAVKKLRERFSEDMAKRLREISDDPG